MYGAGNWEGGSIFSDVEVFSDGTDPAAQTGTRKEVGKSINANLVIKFWFPSLAE